MRHTQTQAQVLHGNDRQYHHTHEDREDDTLDNGLEQEGRIVSADEAGKNAQSGATRRAIRQSDPRRQPYARETIYAV